MARPDIVIVHRGGLGDFLMAWPAMFGLCEHHADRALYWLGPADRLPWLAPLGVKPCPGRIRHAVEALFLERSRPGEPAGSQIYWFGLLKRPLVGDHPGLVFLPGLCPDARIVVRQAYAEQLQARGIPQALHWLDSWQKLFAPLRPRRAAGSRFLVLLFPGAGHRTKQWPMDQFFVLARWLETQGCIPRFVLGPAETERGVHVSGFPVDCPSSVRALSDMLCRADAVLGNDSGPMHLAGMLGIPGVALFGPACEARWAPLGLDVLTADVPCRPCSLDGRIDCTDARCMRDIAQDVVREGLLRVLDGSFSRPSQRGPATGPS